MTYADLATLAAATPATLTLGDATGKSLIVPQGSIMAGIRMKSDVAFSGGTGTALGVTVGKNSVATPGTATFFVPTSYNLFAPVTDTNVSETPLFSAGQNSSFWLTITLTGNGTVNLNTFTAGQFHIDVFIWQFGPINMQLYPPTVNPAY